MSHPYYATGRRIAVDGSAAASIFENCTFGKPDRHHPTSHLLPRFKAQFDVLLDDGERRGKLSFSVSKDASMGEILEALTKRLNNKKAGRDREIFEKNRDVYIARVELIASQLG